jgi:hypothetical protein
MLIEYLNGLILPPLIASLIRGFSKCFGAHEFDTQKQDRTEHTGFVLYLVHINCTAKHDKSRESDIRKQNRISYLQFCLCAKCNIKSFILSQEEYSWNTHSMPIPKKSLMRNHFVQNYLLKFWLLIQPTAIDGVGLPSVLSFGDVLFEPR